MIIGSLQRLDAHGQRLFPGGYPAPLVHLPVGLQCPFVPGDTGGDRENKGAHPSPPFGALYGNTSISGGSLTSIIT